MTLTATHALNLATGTLDWVHQKGIRPRTWILRAGGPDLASLTWEKTLGTTATARTAGQLWRFERQGIFRRRLRILDQAGRLIAQMNPDWLGRGDLSLEGRKYHWQSTSLWRSRWEFSADNTRLLQFRLRRWTFHPAGEVTVTHAALKYEPLPLLLLFGWYLCILSWKDQAHS